MPSKNIYPPKLTSRTQQVYLLLTGLFAVGVVTQVFLAGLGVLVNPSYFAWHTTFAHLLEALMLGLLVLGMVGRVGWRTYGLSALVFALFMLQYAFMYEFEGPVRALHLVNALALFWLAVEIVRRTWRLVSTTRPSGVTSSAPSKAAVGRALAGGVAVVLGATAIFGVVFDNGPEFIRTDTPNEPDGTRGLAAASTASGVASGEPLFAQHCMGCHGEAGEGGFGPALAKNDDLVETEHVVTQILGGGGGMPAFGEELSDEEVAALGTHIRSSWGNDFGPVNAADVAEQR